MVDTLELKYIVLSQKVDQIAGYMCKDITSRQLDILSQRHDYYLLYKFHNEGRFTDAEIRLLPDDVQAGISKWRMYFTILSLLTFLFAIITIVCITVGGKFYDIGLHLFIVSMAIIYFTSALIILMRRLC